MIINKAVIVAAGLSSRLYPLTIKKPKVMLEINGKEILKRSIDILKMSGVEEIAIIVGYKKDMIIDSIGKDVTYIFNPFYKHCNNMGSLWFARHFIRDDNFIYLHGDIIYHEDILRINLQHFLKNNNDIELVTDFNKTDKEAMKVKANSDNYLIESDKSIPLDEANGEWIGVAFINSETQDIFNYIEQILFEDDLNHYDTYAFTKMAKEGYKIFCSSTHNLPWVEIDYVEDYEKAKEIFR